MFFNRKVKNVHISVFAFCLSAVIASGALRAVSMTSCDVVTGPFSTQILYSFDDAVRPEVVLDEQQNEFRIFFKNVDKSSLEKLGMQNKLQSLIDDGIIQGVSVVSGENGSTVVLNLAKIRSIKNQSKESKMKSGGENCLYIQWLQRFDKRFAFEIFTKEKFDEMVAFLLRGAFKEKLTTSFSKNNTIHIVIDPGHGGTALGACYQGVREKDFNLMLAKKLQTMLTNHGYKVTLTRETDTDVPLGQRASLAAACQADVFVSLHANASGSYNATEKGIETYHTKWDNLPAALKNKKNGCCFYHWTPDKKEEVSNAIAAYKYCCKEESANFASHIQKNLIRFTQYYRPDIVDRGVKNEYFVVLIANSIPAVLVEVGFLSCPEELELLVKDDYQNYLAMGIASGIDTYATEVLGVV